MLPGTAETALYDDVADADLATAPVRLAPISHGATAAPARCRSGSPWCGDAHVLFSTSPRLTSSRPRCRCSTPPRCSRASSPPARSSASNASPTTCVHASPPRSSAIDELPLTGASPLPGAVGDPALRRRARLRLRFPLDNFGPSLPNLLAAVAGNLFEIKELSAIRLIDLELPPAFAEPYPGPAFGVEGTRRLMGRPDGAMIGTIVKPSIGLSPAELAEVVCAARRGRHRLHQGRRAAGQRAERPARRAGRRGHAGARALRRPHRPQAHVRVQHHRRHRAPRGEPRPRRRRGRNVRDGVREPDRPRRAWSSSGATATSRSTGIAPCSARSGAPSRWGSGSVRGRSSRASPAPTTSTRTASATSSTRRTTRCSIPSLRCASRSSASRRRFRCCRPASGAASPTPPTPR